jgi:hypothetical protein
VGTWRKSEAAIRDEKKRYDWSVAAAAATHKATASDDIVRPTEAAAAAVIFKKTVQIKN